MKYLPLVWAAIARKPVRAVMTLLSVTVAFTLFGLMLGFSATINLIEENSRADRVFTGPRFAQDMPIAQAGQIARVKGVKEIAISNFINGYVVDPKNRSFVWLIDDHFARVFPEWVPPDAFRILRANRTGLLMSHLQAQAWGKKVGDKFTIIAPQSVRADGAKSWSFTVVAIVPDMPQTLTGYNMANYEYYDKSLPADKQGRVGEVDMQVDDPAKAPEVADAIDQAFVSSGTAMQSITEKAAYAVSNNFGGLDVNALTGEIALAGLGMILFLTANVVAQSVRERFAEFAALKTIGFTDGRVLLLVVLEAAAPCVAGAVLGVGAAALLGRLLPHLLPAGFGLPAPTMAAGVFVSAAAAALVLAVLSAALPALRLQRMDIAAALSGRT